MEEGKYKNCINKRLKKHSQSENTFNAKEKAFDEEKWISKGLIIKIKNKEFCGGRFYNRKGKRNQKIT